MIARLITLAVLIAVLAGGTWFIFRDTPKRQVSRWRKASQIFFEQGDLEKAERFNLKILEMLPQSVQDRLFRAQISEQKSTLKSLLQSLAIYDSILREYGAPATGVHLYRTRTLRMLGRFNEAKGVALSVMDVFPFEASMQLGRLALDKYEHNEALNYFGQARFFAENSPTRRLQTYAAEALVYKTILELSSSRDAKNQAENESS